MLFKLIEVPYTETNIQTKIDQIKLPIYFKFALRCLTICMKHPKLIDQFFQLKKSVQILINFIELLKD